jgi:hypothetical protein
MINFNHAISPIAIQFIITVVVPPAQKYAYDVKPPTPTEPKFTVLQTLPPSKPIEILGVLSYELSNVTAVPVPTDFLPD